MTRELRNISSYQYCSGKWFDIREHRFPNSGVPGTAQCNVSLLLPVFKFITLKKPFARVYQSLLTHFIVFLGVVSRGQPVKDLLLCLL